MTDLHAGSSLILIPQTSYDHANIVIILFTFDGPSPNVPEDLNKSQPPKHSSVLECDRFPPGKIGLIQQTLNRCT